MAGMRECDIEREFVRQAESLGFDVIATQVELPLGRLDVLARRVPPIGRIFAVLEIKSVAAGGEAVAQVMSYAEQVSMLIRGDYMGVASYVVAPELKGEAIRAWHAGLCDFIRVTEIQGEMRFALEEEDCAVAAACCYPPLTRWRAGRVLHDLIFESLCLEAQRLADSISPRLQAHAALEGGSRLPSKCVDELGTHGSFVLWGSK
jgi:hypothetical protein